MLVAFGTRTQFLVGFFFFWLGTASYAQEESSSKGVIGLADRVVDFFSGEIPLRENTHPIQWVVAPVVAYAPETSWQFGVGGKLLFRPKRALESTRTSFIAFAVRYTLNNQLLASPDYTFFSYDERYIHRGEIAFIQFPRLYYGIGNDTPVENEELFSSKVFSVEHLLYRNLFGKLYGGLGLRYALTYDVGAVQDGLLANENVVGLDGNQAVGWDLGVMFDNRDNVLSTTSGVLAEFRQRFHRRWLGSDFSYSVGVLDVRHYTKPFQHRKDIIASQLYGYFSFGDTPFTELAPLGGDMIMRGYYEGRYLDNLLMAVQTEYRVHIWKNLGGVGFVGLGDVAEEFRAFNLPDLKPSAGVGLRYALIPEENLNIRVDVAFGKATNNFYINISEAF